MNFIYLIYVRKLSFTEGDREFIYVTKEFRSMFPKVRQKFSLIIHDEKYIVNLDEQYRIWCGEFRKKVKFQKGVEFEIFKSNDDEYRLITAESLS